MKFANIWQRQFTKKKLHKFQSGNKSIKKDSFIWRHTQKLRRHQPYKYDFYIYFICVYFSEFLRYNYDQEIKNCLLQLENLLVNIKYVRTRALSRAQITSHIYH